MWAQQFKGEAVGATVLGDADAVAPGALSNRKVKTSQR